MKKVTKESLPNDFTLTLALIDAIPVVLFSISMILLTKKFDSILFMIAAFLIALSGLLKVLWKLLLPLIHKNIYFLYIQMHYLMPLSGILLIISLIIDHSKINFNAIYHALVQMPNCIFYLLFIVAMTLMGVFAKKLDSNDLKSNYIEQITNAIGQLCLLLGILW